MSLTKGESQMIKTNKRRMKIFELLKEHPKGITGDKIAEQLSVSSRTIRSDIKKIQEAIPDAKVLASSNRGYKLSMLGEADDLYKKKFFQ